jgi:diacylglycerol kinase (ATP)
MAEQALVIANPAAGKRTAHEGDLDECVRILRAAGFAVALSETGAEHPTAAELAAKARHEGYPSVIVAGGDGTVADAASELLDSRVTLGVLPFGSFMNIARGLRLPLVPTEAAAVIAQRRVSACDVGEVNRKLFFETCGVGLDADAFGAARLAERGRWRSAFRRIASWATRAPRLVEISIDGKASRHEVLQVLVVNSPYYAWAFPVIPNADMTDGILDVAIFPRMGRRALLRSLVEIARRGRPATPPLIARGRVIELSSKDAMPVHADGQIAGRLPVTVRCRAGALRVYAR